MLLNISLPLSLDSALQDITNNIKIQPGLCIYHPNYQPLEPSSLARENLQKMPMAVQNQYLSWQLKIFLYGIYYNGWLRSKLSLGNISDIPEDLENNTYLGVDMQFYSQLHQSNQGEGYFDPGWLVLHQENDGSFAVVKNDLKLYIQPEKHLQQLPQIGDIVSIWMPPNLVQNGFYIAVGNQGKHRHQPEATTVRIYFNLTPQGAVVVMQQLTDCLNKIAIPFCFKVLYNPSDYQRSDAGVLYFSKKYYTQVKSIIENIYINNQPNFQADIPLFTKYLAPGLAVAEEPNINLIPHQESFGMNRCRIIANALLKTYFQGSDNPKNRMLAIIEQFAQLNLDIQRPYLNTKSEDIY